MKLKIEDNKPMGKNGVPSAVFLQALKDSKVGQSFLLPMTSWHRHILAACPILIGARFITRKEGKLYRVGRIA